MCSSYNCCIAGIVGTGDLFCRCLSDFIGLVTTGDFCCLFSVRYVLLGSKGELFRSVPDCDWPWLLRE